jgi:hypothetical protein
MIALAAVIVAAGCIAWRRADPYRRDMRPVYAVIAKGEQGWADEATRMLDEIIVRSADKHALAERLLRETDGSLAAEGMVLAVRSRHPRARELLESRLSDHRWNWSLVSNDELAKQLLLSLNGRPIEKWVTAWLERRHDR